MKRLAVGLILLLAATATATATAEPARRLSLAEAVALALRESPDVKAAGAGLLEARAKRRGTRYLWAPKLKVTGNLILWDSKLPFKIPPPNLTNIVVPDGCFLPDACMGLFDQLFGALDLGNIREQFTAQLNVRLIQPLTPLYSVSKLAQIDALGVEMEEARIERTRSQARYDVVEAYLQVYRAETYVGIMEEAQALVKAHLERIARLLAEEMVRQAEQLKVQVKAAEVEQGLLQARASRRLARSNLARLVGLDLDASLALTERFPDPPPPYPLTLAQCVARALRGRPEIRMTQLGQAQARAGRAAKLWQLVPTVAAVAQFEANHGTGSFLPKASFFVGAVMEWELDWGKTLRDADEISAKGQRAAALEHKARTAIPMEVRKYHSDLEVALASLKVTRAAVTAATESLRIQVKRFELSAAASTDVLDAQMDLTQARAKATDALHRYYLARAALDRVMGDER